MVYITTRSPAVVTYVLGLDWKQQLNGSYYLLHNATASNWTEIEEEELSMRILRAGGAVLDTTFPEPYQHEMRWTQYNEQFGAFTRTKDFIFGWPDNGGLWMLYLDGLVPREYWKAPYVNCCMDDGNIPLECWESMEREDEYYVKYISSGLPIPLADGAFNSTKLNQAETMSEFCIELEKHGATFYEDPKKAREAVKLGFFDTNVLTKTWNGFTEWRELELQRRCKPGVDMEYDAGIAATRSSRRWWFM